MKTKTTRIIAIFMLLLIASSILLTPITAFAVPPVVEVDKDKTTKDGVFDNFNISVDGKGNLTSGISAENNGFEAIVKKYKNFIVGVAAIGAVTMVALFIVQFLKLGQSAGNPQARSQALAGVMWTGVAAAGLGSVSLITALFYKAIE